MPATAYVKGLLLRSGGSGVDIKRHDVRIAQMQPEGRDNGIAPCPRRGLFNRDGPFDGLTRADRDAVEQCAAELRRDGNALEEGDLHGPVEMGGSPCLCCKADAILPLLQEPPPGAQDVRGTQQPLAGLMLHTVQRHEQVGFVGIDHELPPLRQLGIKRIRDFGADVVSGHRNASLSMETTADWQALTVFAVKQAAFYLILFALRVGERLMSEPIIVCCGEALVDMLPEMLANGREAFVPYPGGAVFNTAVALGRLGVPVGLVTGLSSDFFGDLLRDALVASAVDASYAVMSERPTTLAFVRLEAGQARYRFYDELSAGRMLQMADMPALPESVSALFFGGISLACEPGAEAYAALAERSEGRVIMVDPNIRPGFIENDVRYRDRLRRVFDVADVVKVSDEDLAWLEPGAASIAGQVAGLRKQGVGLVLVTRGGEGVEAWLPDGSQMHVPVSPVDVVDTVGAGDTFNAVFLASLAANGCLTREFLGAPDAELLGEAIAQGARVAALTVQRAGANPPWRDELEA